MKEIGGLVERDFATPIAIAPSAQKQKVRYPNGVSLEGSLIENAGERRLVAISYQRIWTAKNAKYK
ncbi:hypothetical protein HC761_01830 [bacterium]|nr:hypothetical protein [bacterium]